MGGFLGLKFMLREKLWVRSQQWRANDNQEREW
jgi:hypothetical protein